MVEFLRSEKMIEDNVEMDGVVEIANDIKKKIQTTGVRGLNYEQAEKLGVFKRIGNLLTIMHSTITAAYIAYGEVEGILDDLNARKMDISREMNMFEKAYDHFFRFWSSQFDKGVSRIANIESDILFHRIMEWMDLPEKWKLGDEQRTRKAKDNSMRVFLPNDEHYTFYKCEIKNDIVGTPKESWCILCYDTKTRKQTVTNSNMDKASALMVAKRLSNENPEKIYSVNIVRDFVESKTEVIPFKAFQNNNTVGKITSDTK